MHLDESLSQEEIIYREVQTPMGVIANENNEDSDG
jgi:hypothetical protein